jgi:hypothetical protein
MTTQARSQCDTCARFRSPLDDGTPAGVTSPYCAAFPDGIPVRVFRNRADHRAAVNGDHGLRWEFKGDDFPEYAFAAADLRPPDTSGGEPRRRTQRERGGP